MCKKTDVRIECIKCGYPYSEARYPDNLNNPLPCNASKEVLLAHIKKVKKEFEEDESM